jgi:hypothetical protein
MKTIRYILELVFIIILILLISCESKDQMIKNSVFYIEISDGTTITEDDILYYDSTSCILFLKDEIYFSYKESESGNRLKNEFTVFVNGDVIYQGVMYPDDYSTMSAAPPMPFYIYRDEYDLDRSVMEIRYSGLSKDLRNDHRIINALKNRGLLSSGISFTIDSVAVFGLYYIDSVTCVITIHNHDPINYYILDPQKMGEAYYNLYNRGLVFTRHVTGYESDFDGIYHSEYGTITEEDFSLLEGNSSLTFKFSSNDYFIAFSGIYKCSFTLRFRSSRLDLNQPNGRIWIGSVSSGIDNIVIEI